ncbi:glycosyltransferase [Thalassotalea eurytherma]|uniref:Glycosyl transferase family 1 n=1 Tax=Thalassotalea eurytherma TaxID=1144278 RepID=A0ABQ6H5K9_9GAMM|nr:glycosyltransferase [Thalassotalea eurytherma]GLX82112.1 glycosyl transferase family 1 [Thalassotalea eurytherma]
MANNKKIKVLQFICSTGFYGAERWVLALSKHLDSDKFTSELAITLEENSQDLELVKHFKQLGGVTHEVPMSNPFDLSVVGKLARLIKEHAIDVVHTHGYKSDILGILAAKKAGVKVVVTPHGFENAKDIKLRSFIWLGCQAMRFADKVVPLSPQLCTDVKPYGIKEPKLVYIQNGVDLSEVDEQRLKPLNKDTKVKHIGFVGQMISRKNIFDLLDIFDELQQKHGNLKLSLLGDGEQRAELEVYASKLSSNADIHFLGFRDDRLELLQSFDLFAMTSSLEGIPRCLMEATAMGIPVAAYNIPGIDQLITHEQSGLLAPLGNKQLLTQYWETILFNEEEAQRLADNARDYVNQHYSAQRMANEYAELFQELVS